jgi:hypothetical protein
VYGVEGLFNSLYPPAPAPAAPLVPPPPPPAITIYETIFSAAQEAVAETVNVPGPVKV